MSSISTSFNTPCHGKHLPIVSPPSLVVWCTLLRPYGARAWYGACLNARGTWTGRINHGCLISRREKTTAQALRTRIAVKTRHNLHFGTHIAADSCPSPACCAGGHGPNPPATRPTTHAHTPACKRHDPHCPEGFVALSTRFVRLLARMPAARSPSSAGHPPTTRVHAAAPVTRITSSLRLERPLASTLKLHTSSASDTGPRCHYNGPLNPCSHVHECESPTPHWSALLRACAALPHTLLTTTTTFTSPARILRL